MCSLDKCFPWWGPYLTTNRLSPETDENLKLPPLLPPLYFGLAAGSVPLLFECWLLSATYNSWIKCPLSASVNPSRCGRKWVWIPCGITESNVFLDTEEKLLNILQVSLQVSIILILLCVAVESVFHNHSNREVSLSTQITWTFLQWLVCPTCGSKTQPEETLQDSMSQISLDSEWKVANIRKLHSAKVDSVYHLCNMKDLLDWATFKIN